MLETMPPPDFPAFSSRAATAIRRSSPCAGAEIFCIGRSGNDQARRLHPSASTSLTLRPLHEGAATARWRSSKTRQKRIPV